MRFFYSSLLTFTVAATLSAQDYPSDTAAMNMDAVYNRPFLSAGKFPVALGGYIEAHGSYFGSDGITEGLSFSVPRMTLFVAGTINNNIRFLSEIELEEGGEEIAIEFAALDVEFHPLLNLRGGVVMNPIGSFNQNHDGPKWEFIERPISSTTIIPSTWSNVGFGLYGKFARNRHIFGYEAYLTNGFDGSIISNGENRTWLPAAKENKERFEESFNGYPLGTLKLAWKVMGVGELGISWMGGVFNKFEEDGIVLDEQRRLDLYAVDFNRSFPKLGTIIIAEYVMARIDVPGTFSQQFGDHQEGVFVDVVQPVLRKDVLNWQNATLNLACRFERTDYNIGTFAETNGNIYDHVTAIVPAISFRPSSETVFRFNYRLSWERDILGNPAVKTVGYQFGMSSYF